MEFDVDVAAQCVPGPGVDASHIALVGPDAVASSAFDVDGMMADSAAYAIAALDQFGAQRRVPAPGRSIDLAHLLAFCTTHIEVDGEPVPAWAELSGVYEGLGGRHLQIHCNFPHHAAGVVERLACAHDRASVAATIATRDVFELEAELIDDGMIGAAIRTLDEWEAHPHAAATRSLPLITVQQIGDADPRGADTAERDEALAGVRALDSSRVLAGPTAGRMLAEFGADVLRIGADHLPSVPVGVMSTGFGKRNTSLDLRTPGDKDAMSRLLEDADVWVDAYRPDAMRHLGLSPERAASLRPGMVMVQISAFDWTGPWAGRRGFDSIVQSTTGVRWAGGEFAIERDEARSTAGPIGLPVQALDYATGFLAAGVAGQLLAHQRQQGGSWLARLSLLRTRDWLVSRGGPNGFHPAVVPIDPRFLTTVDSGFGQLTSVAPFAGSLGSPPTQLGSSDAVWLD